MEERLLPTPTDEVGMPLSLRPPEYPVLFNRPDLFDRNHAFHPASDPDLSDNAGQALRNSRVQYADWWEHHNGYHGNFEGPPLPTSRQKKFGLTVMSAALYIPEEAIDCRDVDPKIVRLTTEERERLWTSGEVKMASSSIVRNFLVDYTLEQDLSHVSESKIDEFLHTEDFRRRKFLGHWLLAQAADKATEPIDLLYRQAWKLGRIPSRLPAKPCSIVKMHLGPKKYRERTLASVLEQKLASAI